MKGGAGPFRHFLLYCSVYSVRAAVSGSETKPNVLFIVADDLGWNDVSWHNRNIHSPVIERLAADGILLDQYYVMPTCTPSRVAMMTGKYPYRVGRQHMYIKPLMPAGLPVNVKIMPQYFKEAGYATHAIGKWHLGFCHQNYTPTFRGFDTFYGFYLGSQDYYLHNKNFHGDVGYDFRLNEQVLKGPEVEGKYSSDLFASRAKRLIKKHKKDGKPWFTYLSLQSVHDPIQVPYAYTKNVCRYKDDARYFYHAMVSAMDHAVDQVIQELKATNQYENTIIVFTTDNGGAIGVGGNNYPLRGTKGTLYEGGTRAIGFVHSPLLKKKGYITRNLMHAVDWLPTLLSAVGQNDANVKELDGISHWNALSKGLKSQRDEIVYNIKESPFMAALRFGKYKLIWGSRTEKNTWFLPQEEILNKGNCEELHKNRTRSTKLLYSGMDNSIASARTLYVGKDDNEELWNEEVELEKIQKQDYIAEERSFLDRNVEVDDENKNSRRVAKSIKKTKTKNRLNRKGSHKNRNKRRGKTSKKDNKKQKNKGNKKQNNKGNKNKNKNNKKKGNNNKGKKDPNKRTNFKRRFKNRSGVQIKPWGEAQLFDLENDPAEKADISQDNQDIVESLKDRVISHFEDLIPKFSPDDTQAGAPSNWGGFYSPGWCQPVYI